MSNPFLALRDRERARRLELWGDVLPDPEDADQNWHPVDIAHYRETFRTAVLVLAGVAAGLAALVVHRWFGWLLALAVVAAAVAVKLRLDRRDWARAYARYGESSPEVEAWQERHEARVAADRAVREAVHVSWRDQVVGWLAQAPLLELAELPELPDDPWVNVPAEAGGVTYAVYPPESLARLMADDIAAPPNSNRRYAFAWVPFPADYADAIVRTFPNHRVGSVYRIADGRTAVHWQYPSGGRIADPWSEG